MQVIFIMTDTQRKDMVGCYGNPAMKTPHLDQLAAEGMRFENAYTCTPVCGPARAALFTGLYPHSCGSWANNMALGDNVKSLGERLSDQGVHAAYVGKWHLDGSDYFGLGECPAGWDANYWYDMRNYLEELNDDERLKSRLARTNDSDIDASFTFGHRCSNRAIDFLTNCADDDFFLALSYDEPHHPFLCPPPYNKMFSDYQMPLSENVMDNLDGKPEHQKLWSKGFYKTDKQGFTVQEPDFFGSNSFIDSEIGRVLSAAAIHAPNALIIYTSDHGDMLGSHSLLGSGKGPVMYEEITNIPFIVKWPGEAAAGSTNHTLVSHIDLTATVLDAFGKPAPQWNEGRSLLPTFRDATVAVNETIYIEFGRYEVDHDGFGGFQPIRCAYDGRYKLVINLMTSDELYDLKDDPGEMNNLIEAPDHVEARNQLHDQLINWMNETRDPFRGYYWHNRPWRDDAPTKHWEHTAMTRQREHEEYERRQLDYATGLVMENATRDK